MAKLENTLENKHKFFAQYYGQKVLKFDIEEDKFAFTFPVDSLCLSEYVVNQTFLELKPLESISGEDAKYLGYADNISATTTYLKSLGKELKEADYLRSKGYALTWMNLSVQDLINYGWIKLV